MATVSNIIAVLFLMVPRFWDMAAGHVDHGMDQRAWAVIVHHTLGGIGVILSLILMVQFVRARGNMARCPNATARLLMRLCLIFLIIPLLMGVGLRLTAL